MNSLGKYCHDFPRLAKESGYTFQLHRGRINWSDLDKLNIQEITDEKNFQLLEQNLIHVINCNLDREYDLKILDQNFVKLFKLAQLGIDYLSYCELYLDRCVILLQEQLASCQEECAQLKEEVELKNEELRKSKKAKLQSENCKCKKCNKVFLNETYLESHEKRRHRNTCETIQRKPMNYIHQAQQTDIEKKFISVFTQTLDNTQLSQDSELPITNIVENLKRSEQEMKIDNLKRDLEDLKIRLSLAEKTMEEKKNDEKSYSSSFASAVIPIIHSYISPTYNGQVPVIPATPAIVSGIPHQPSVRNEVLGINAILKEDCKTEKNAFSMNCGNMPRHSSFEEIPRQKSSPERFPAEGASTVGSGSVNSNDIFTNNYEGLKENKEKTPPQLPFISLDNEITDVRPKLDNKPSFLYTETENNLSGSPRSQMFLEDEKHTNDLPGVSIRASPIGLLGDLKIESESPSESIGPLTSTPAKLSPRERSCENETKLIEEKNVFTGKHDGRRITQEPSFRERNSFEGEVKSKFFLRKIVRKKSPKIQELTANLKNSFSQLYGSVSSIGRESPDSRGAITKEKSKSDIIERLHKRLRELGIDPEWTGIPTQTMQQKLNILKHNRNLLDKESHLYPYIRRKLQKHVLKKLKNYSPSERGKTRSSAQSFELGLEEPNATTSTENLLLSEANEIIINDSDFDLEGFVTKEGKRIPSLSSTASDLPNKAQQGSLDSIGPLKFMIKSPKKTKWSKHERETTDLSIFQAGKFKSSKMKHPEKESKMEEEEKPVSARTVDRWEINSDLDDKLYAEQARENLPYMLNKSPGKDVIASFPAKSEENISKEGSWNTKTESLSILKSEMDKLQFMSKKKVLFAEEPEIIESTTDGEKFSIEKQKILDLPPVVDDGDDWSIESEWVVNNDVRIQ